jgi:hypothetical protein
LVGFRRLDLTASFALFAGWAVLLENAKHKESRPLECGAGFCLRARLERLISNRNTRPARTSRTNRASTLAAPLATWTAFAELVVPMPAARTALARSVVAMNADNITAHAVGTWLMFAGPALAMEAAAARKTAAVTVLKVPIIPYSWNFPYCRRGAVDAPVCCSLNG